MSAKSGRSTDSIIPAFLAAVYLILCAVPLTLAQRDSESEMVSGRTIISDVPWDPASLVNEKLIYGTDDRIDVYQETVPLRQQLSDSTVGLFFASDIRDNGNGTFSIDLFQYRQGPNLLPACAGEPYGAQPVAAFCSGFLVGNDIIVTAGHCYFPSSLSTARFVFGFEMADATTPINVVDANRVYQGVEILGRAFTNIFEDDWAVIRVDRPVTSPGASPLEIRRSGIVPVGTPLGLIGHPSGLPQKIAFGPTTRVTQNPSSGFFRANLDAYGGNSGSPVFDAETGVVEGILVRGFEDFVFQATCFESNVFPDSAPGAESTRTTIFEQLIPPIDRGKGVIALDKSRYTCADTVLITVRDSNVSGAASVVVTTSGGDSETIVLEESGSSGRFEGSIEVNSSSVGTENGALNVVDGDTITATYNDEDDGTGEAAVVEATAEVDCTPPEISDVFIDGISVGGAVVNLTTDEAATPTIRFGLSCETLDATATGLAGTSHQVALNGLGLGTTYFLEVDATDLAGNQSTDTNDGECYSFTTTSKTVYFTEQFSGVRDLNNTSITFRPNDSHNAYTICRAPAAEFPTDPTRGRLVALADDESREITLAAGATVSLYGEEYGSYFIGSNGYITFGAEDNEHSHSLDAHFGLPRISGLFTDLDPSAGGTITRQQRGDRVVVTYDDVPEYDFGGSNSFQIEMFFDGTIRITHLYARATFAMVGISEGFGTPTNYVATDMTGVDICALGGGVITSNNTDGFIEDGETLILTAPLSPTSAYEWFKGNNVIEGETGRTLTFENITNMSNGLYSVTWNDGSKVLFRTPPYSIGVIPAGMLPLMDPLGLAILAGVLFVVGVVLLRRHPQGA